MATAQLGTLLRHIHKLAVTPDARQGSDRQLLDDFSVRRDEAAFAALVVRHGPMVLRVCRRVLNHEQDAEDAFQATFLVLARHTGSIRKREALASWLYGVAQRTAMKAKRSAARRRNHETQLRAAKPSPAVSPSWDEVQAVLDEEIQRLPDTYRAAFVHCVLEGKSAPQAAAEWGVKEGTVWSRLARARRLLQQRLTRRGIKLAGVLAALAVVDGAARARVPAGLANLTIRSGLLVAAGKPAAGLIPSHIAALAAGVTRAMFLTRAKIAVVALLAAGLLAGGGVWAHRALAAPGDEPKADAKRQEDVKSLATEKAGTLDVRGRVLDPDGKPVLGARLSLVYGYSWVSKVPAKGGATSIADGRFEFAVANEALNDPWCEDNRNNCYVVAAAEGYGATAAKLPPEAACDVTLRLVEDDVPLQGRLLDLQGKPVVGATVRIDNLLFVPKKGDLTAWLEELKSDKESPGRVDGIRHLLGLWSPALVALFPPVTTGADGRFTIKGIGRERVVGLRIEGPTIVTHKVRVMTRRGDTIRVPEDGVFTFYGTGFDLVIPPTKPVVGVVRDRATGKPLAGMKVHTYYTSGTPVTTDQEGRYRLVGLPKGPGHEIAVRSDDLPYLGTTEPVPDTPGLEPVTVDFALQRGVWVTGRVTDKATGQPVAAGVECYSFLDNPNLKNVRLTQGSNWYATKEDGSFRAIALPGPGFITVKAAYDRYRRGVCAEAFKAHRDVNLDGIDAQPSSIIPENYHALVAIDPTPSAESITCDVVLDPGRTLKGLVVGPDGKPLSGARASGQQAMNFWDHVPLKEAEFTMLSLGDDESRLIQVMHEGKQLAGSRVVRSNDKEPVRIQLRPWGSVTGRLVPFSGGEPLAGVAVAAHQSGKKEEATQVGFLPDHARPGKDGRFRLDGLVPGLTYNLGVVKGNPDSYYGLETDPALNGITVKSGEIKDLGDIQVKPMD